MEALEDRVIVKPEARDKTSAGGIIIPDTAKETTRIGVVVSVGAGRPMPDGKMYQIPLKVGDRVLFRRTAGLEFQHEGETLLVIGSDDLAAKVSHG